MNTKKIILTNVMYLAIFLLAYAVYEHEKTTFSVEATFLSKYSAIIANALLAFGCFYEIYYGKSKPSK